jgi:hypothetical protein
MYRYKGPFTIIQKISDDTYLIEIIKKWPTGTRL